MTRYEGKTIITLEVNGEAREVAVRPSDILLDVLRDKLGITSPKPGCLNGDCGACTVSMDGYPVKSCLVLAVEAQGRKLLSVVGLGDSPEQ